MRIIAKLLSISVVSVILFCACSSREAAHVGDFSISERLVEYRNQVSKIFYPAEPKPAGLAQLIRAYTFAQIMKNHGRVIADTDLAREEKRIETDTRDPASLAKIKAIFGRDHDGYLKAFILPNYVERVFYAEFFMQNPEFQQSAQNTAMEFFKEASAHPEQFVELARKRALPLSRISLSTDGVKWSPYGEKKIPGLGKGSSIVDESSKSAVQKDVRENLEKESAERTQDEARQWIQGLLPLSQVGKVVPKIVTQNDGWVVLQYLGKHKFLGVFFPKADFWKWVEEEKKNVPVTPKGIR